MASAIPKDDAHPKVQSYRSIGSSTHKSEVHIWLVTIPGTSLIHGWVWKVVKLKTSYYPSFYCVLAINSGYFHHIPTSFGDAMRLAAFPRVLSMKSIRSLIALVYSSLSGGTKSIRRTYVGRWVDRCVGMYVCIWFFHSSTSPKKKSMTLRNSLLTRCQGPPTSNWGLAELSTHFPPCCSL